MKKALKIISSILLIVMVISMVTVSFADTVTPSQIGGKINTSGTSSIQSIGGQIIGFIQVIGSIASVGVLVVLGIKYMMGSTEEKAEYKKTMLPYVIGAVLIFAAANLANMVYNFASAL